jgi:molybdopterin converting factor small subunit
MPVVLVPTAYRGPTHGESRIEVTGPTLGACLDEIEARHPGFRDLVVDARSAGLHRFVKLFLNGEELGRGSEVLDTPVSSRDEIEVLAAIAGG